MGKWTGPRRDATTRQLVPVPACSGMERTAARQPSAAARKTAKAIDCFFFFATVSMPPVVHSSSANQSLLAWSLSLFFSVAAVRLCVFPSAGSGE